MDGGSGRVREDLFTAEDAKAAKEHPPFRTPVDIEIVAREVVDSAMKVHTVLGPGLLESAYKACLGYELQKRGLRVRSEVELPIIYDSVKVSAGYRDVLHLKDGIRRMVNGL